MVFPESSDQVILCKDFEWLVFLLVLISWTPCFCSCAAKSAQREETLQKNWAPFLFNFFVFLPFVWLCRAGSLANFVQYLGVQFWLELGTNLWMKAGDHQGCQIFLSYSFLHSKYPNKLHNFIFCYDSVWACHTGQSHCMPSHCWLLKASEDNNGMDLVSVTCAADFYSSLDASSTWI